MTSRLLLKGMTGFYLVIFFAYLFGPLILMSMSAFNSSEFPRVSPWECFTFEWFNVLLQDQKLVDGFINSLIIGAGVVVLSVALGLAAAMMLTQILPGARPFYYTIVISPVLVPGVVLGISTLIFWDRLGVMFDADYNSFFYDGIFLTIVGQSTFISAYCMLVFIARLQRFDPTLEEAALDLGATNAQAFRKILLPFLKPAIGSAAVLAFLASFENYNTTVFTIVSESTLTTVLAGKVRYGINPSISSLAVIIVVLTIVGAIIHEAMRRREELAMAGGGAANAAASAPGRGSIPPIFRGNPAMVLLMLVFIAGLGTTWFAARYSPAACKEDVLQQKRLLQQRKGPNIFTTPTTPSQPAAPAQPSAPAQPTTPPASDAPKPFGNTFDPGNLQQQTPGNNTTPAPESSAPADSGSGAFGNVFDPGNLKKQAPGAETAPPAPKPESSAPANSGNGAFGNVFDPGNLKKQVAPGE